LKYRKRNFHILAPTQNNRVIKGYNIFFLKNEQGHVRKTKKNSHTMEVQKVDTLDILASAQNIRGNALCSVDCSSNQSFG
jgi:hypothetical protein